MKPRNEFSAKNTAKQQVDDYNASNASPKQAQDIRVKRAANQRASGKSASTNQLRQERAREEAKIVRMPEKDEHL